MQQDIFEEDAEEEEEKRGGPLKTIGHSSGDYSF